MNDGSIQLFYGFKLQQTAETSYRDAEERRELCRSEKGVS